MFDCHINASGRVRLIDFNPWGGATLPLLFEWDELEQLAGARAPHRTLLRARPCVLRLACSRLLFFQPPLTQRSHAFWPAGAPPATGVSEDGPSISFPIVRVINSAQAIRPGLRVGVPFEMFDTSSTSALADLVRKWGSADEGRTCDEAEDGQGQLGEHSAGRTAGSSDGRDTEGGRGVGGDQAATTRPR